MAVSLGFRRTVALHLALLLCLLPALTHLSQARAEVPGIKKVVVVGAAAVGGIALLSTIFKKAASKGAEMAVKGVAKSGLTGMLGGLFGKPWILIPVVIGVGIVAYYLWQKYFSPAAYGRDDYNRYNQTDGRRYDNPANRQQVFGNSYSYLNPYDNVGLAQAAARNPQMNANVGGVAGTQAASNVNPGTYSSGYVPSFTDQIKSALSFGAYQPAQQYLASASYGGSGGLNLGNNGAFAVHAPPYGNGLGTLAVQGPNGISGSAFDLPGIGDPARLGRTDVIGRGLTNGDETLTLNRSSMLMGPNSPVDTDTLVGAQAARDDAYTKMVTALKGSVDGSFNGDVQAAIATYRAADEALKAKQATASK